MTSVTVAMLVSSRLLVASDFRVFARSVIWLVGHVPEP
jgi:hypothetical protein